MCENISDRQLELERLINESKKIAILSGAGVSTGSGIRDFRGENGMYKDLVYGLPPEELLSILFFDTYRDLFYQYYVKNMLIPEDIKPNKNHEYAKKLYTGGKLAGVITQNIDGLYQKAGLPNDAVVEIHGNGNRWICIKCKQYCYLEDCRFNEKSGNYLSPCHDFIVRPDIVLYGENFNSDNVKRMNNILEEADLLLVMGTSLQIDYHEQRVANFIGKIALLNNQPVTLQRREWDFQYIGNIEDVLSIL